jgi:alpha-glucosidase
MRNTISRICLDGNYVPDVRPDIPIQTDQFIVDPQKWKFLGQVVNYHVEDNVLTLIFEEGRALKLSFLSKSIFRIRFDISGDYKTDNSYSIINDFGKGLSINIEDSGTILTVNTTELRVEINKQCYSVTAYEGDMAICTDHDQSLGWYKDESANPQTYRMINYKKVNKGARYFGFGEKSGNLNKKGASMTNWNYDAYGYGFNSDPLYLGIPFFVEVNEQGFTYGIFFDNPSQTFYDMGYSHPEYYYFGSQSCQMNYYFIYGQTLKEVINQYTEMTGRIPMPPRYILGFQQSRFSYPSEAIVSLLADTFRRKHIPCDVIYLDVDFQDEFKNFTWNENTFPYLETFLQTLHGMGFKIGTIVTPAIRRDPSFFVYLDGLNNDPEVFIRMPDSSYVVGQESYGNYQRIYAVYPDLTNPEFRQWWGRLYQRLIEVADFTGGQSTGIDIIWNDMNEPATRVTLETPFKTLPMEALHYDFGRWTPHQQIHNIYGMTVAQGTHEGLMKYRPNERNFSLSRSGYAGLQRYAGTWTGDNSSTWDHIKLNITMILNLGISAISIAGADIGGFTGLVPGEPEGVGQPTAEMFARWISLAAFMPFYRVHYQKGKPPQEPWAFGSEVEEISRKYINLRYQLIQYLYDFVYECHKTGIPMVRPVFMEYPNDQKLYEDQYQYQFLCGDVLLIAPVVDQGAKIKEVYLPEGYRWYSFWDNTLHDGGQSLTVKAPLDTVSIFVREGAVIPMQEVEQFVGELTFNPITFFIYPGAEYTHFLYQDDGLSMNYDTNEEYIYTKIIHKTTGKTQSISFDVLHNLPEERRLIAEEFPLEKVHFFVKFMVSNSKPKDIAVQGTHTSVIEVSTLEFLLTSTDNAFFYDSEQKVTMFKLLGIPGMNIKSIAVGN